MQIDGDVDGLKDELAFLRAFVALVKEHGGHYGGYIYALDDENEAVGTFDWAELLAQYSAGKAPDEDEGVAMRIWSVAQSPKEGMWTVRCDEGTESVAFPVPARYAQAIVDACNAAEQPERVLVRPVVVAECQCNECQPEATLKAMVDALPRLAATEDMYISADEVTQDVRVSVNPRLTTKISGFSS